MLKGHVFNMQTFTSEAFALFIDKFLNGKSGVARGCELSNTNNSITIGEGYFVVKGRLLQIISSETISNVTVNGFYSLVCEIDLSKTNTTDELNQAKIKVVSNTNNYPELQKQDITANGTIYQYEFARFKVENGNITNVEDKRTFIDFDTIYNYIQKESDEMFKKIAKELEHVLDGSAYCLKNDLLKMKVKEIRERLINEKRVDSVIFSIVSEMMIYIRKNKEEDWKMLSGYYREKIDMLYLSKVREIVGLLDEDNEYKAKLENWYNNVNFIKNANNSNKMDFDQEEVSVVSVQDINFLRLEKQGWMFITPSSSQYPDNSLTTIIENLYKSLE